MTETNLYYEMDTSQKNKTHLYERVGIRPSWSGLIKHKSVSGLSEVNVTFILNPVHWVTQDHVVKVVLFYVADRGVVQALEVVEEGEQEVDFLPF